MTGNNLFNFFNDLTPNLEYNFIFFKSDHWVCLKSLKLHPRFLHLRPFLASRPPWMHGEAQGNQSEERGDEERRLKRNETSFPLFIYFILFVYLKGTIHINEHQYVK